MGALVAAASQERGPVLQVSDDGGASFHEVNLSDITEVIFLGLDGDDQLRVDNENGFVAREKGLRIAFVGGNGFDQLFLVGSPGNRVTEVHEGTPGQPTVLITIEEDGRSQALKLSGVESVVDLISETEFLNKREGKSFVQ